ncbi:hypothetical protein [Stenotrophomonas rhizophila]|uniref:hypothetical protein n=1 Tax=Stenotrophomonas rhizophila TaxID=216778 RepID=UPI0033927566
MIATLLVLAISMPDVQVHSSSPSIHEKMVAQETALLGLTPQQRGRLLNETYGALVDETIFRRGCAGMEDEDVDDVFSSTALIAFYRRNAQWVERLQCLHSALADRDKAELRHHLKLHGLLLSIRRFDDANELQKRYGIPVPALPTLDTELGGGLNVIDMVDQGRLKHMVLSPRVEAGIQVIATVHPSCGFSRRALDAILSNPRYAWLLPYMQLVVPREAAWPEGSMRAWNDNHPTYPMYAQSTGKAWEPMETLETPVFHLLHNGALVVSATGWNGDGAELDTIRRALERLELSNEAGRPHPR